MPPEQDFDISSAVDSIGSDLGFGAEEEGSGDLDFQVEPLTDKPVIEGEVAATETDKAAEEASTTEETETTSTEVSTEPPKTWRKEAAAEWAKLPPVVQAEIAKREDDIFKGIEGYKADASFGKTVNQVLAPFMPILTQHNIDPVAQISGLMQAHHTLALGSPEQKLALFQKIAGDYGIPLDQLGAEAPYVDPQVKDLQAKLNQLQSTVTAEQQQKQEQQATKEIETFANNPANIYFKELAVPMGDLIRSGKASNLAEAYEQAIWLNPAIRAKEIARQQTESSQKAAEEAKAKANAAKQATASNVKTSAKSAATASPLGSIEDTLTEAMAAIKARG